MASPNSQEVPVLIEELINATRKGTFQWKAVNPTTYLSEKMTAPGTGGRLTLQRAEQTSVQQTGPGQAARIVRSPSVILQVVEIKSGAPQAPILTISGAVNPSLNQKLQELFSVAASGVSEHGLEFLKSLISHD
jgi:hypothetical protein